MSCSTLPEIVAAYDGRHTGGSGRDRSCSCAGGRTLGEEPTMPFREQAFQSFRDDHRNVLARLATVEARLAATGAAAPAAAEEPALRELVRHLDAQFATHMRDEENVLFPALAAALPETAAGLDGLRDEHTELRQMLADIATLLDQGPSAARDERLHVQMRDFIDLLRLHVHKEEDAVFRVASRVLPEDEARALARRIAARRPVPAPPGR
jgi:hemerythrin-like domain-containing protein